jgi:hypothetical protein
MFLFEELIQRVITPGRLQKWDRDPILDKVLPVGRFSPILSNFHLLAGTVPS